MKIFLVYFSNNVGGACQSFLALKKFLDQKGIDNEVMCPSGPVLRPDIELPNSKIMSFFIVLSFMTKMRFAGAAKRNIFVFNTIVLAPLAVFSNTALWVHEVTLDGHKILYRFLQSFANRLVKNLYCVNNSMKNWYPSASLLEIPYSYLNNIATCKKERGKAVFKACMIVRPIKNKGIKKFFEIANKDNLGQYAILTQEKEFEEFCDRNRMDIPSNMSVEPFNNLYVREEVLRSSVFHLNLSELPETVGLNSVEAISYGCIALSTDNMGSRMILNDKFIIKTDSLADIILSITNLALEDVSLLNDSQRRRIFKNYNTDSQQAFMQDFDIY